MGGNATKTTRRFMRDEYLVLVNEIQSYLSSHNIVSDEIVSYRNKESFGDMDVLIRNDKLVGKFNSVKEYIMNVIKKELNPIEWLPNGDVISFNYKDIQVDFIFQNFEWYEFSKSYFSYNDCSNLCGRVIHKQGFKFGHDGLWYIVRDGDYVVEEILVSRDFNYVLDVFGFDVGVYSKGFDDLKGIFDYVVSSKYFTPSIFLLENRNHIARMRDKKRPTYTSFLNYIKDMPVAYEYKSKQEYLSHYLENNTFIGFKENYDIALAKNERRKKINLKFNGVLVGDLTGYEHKELGKFIKDYKNSFSSIDVFNDFVYSANGTEIEKSIIIFKEKLYEQIS